MEAEVTIKGDADSMGLGLIMLASIQKLTLEQRTAVMELVGRFLGGMTLPKKEE